MCSALILGLLAGQAYAAPADTAPSGVDQAAVDPAVRPQDDFFRYSQGKWLHDVDNPADRASWGAFNVAQENVETQIRTLIEQAAQDKAAAPGSKAQKMGDYYASDIDRAHRDALGATQRQPAQPPGFLRRVRRQAGRPDVSRAAGPRRVLVTRPVQCRSAVAAAARSGRSGRKARSADAVSYSDSTRMNLSSRMVNTWTHWLS